MKPQEAHIMQLARCSVRFSAYYTVARGIKLKNLIMLLFLKYRNRIFAPEKTESTLMNTLITICTPTTHP